MSVQVATNTEGRLRHDRCRRGHDLTDSANVKLSRDGYRKCRPCARLNDNAYKERQRRKKAAFKRVEERIEKEKTALSKRQDEYVRRRLQDPLWLYEKVQSAHKDAVNLRVRIMQLERLARASSKSPKKRPGITAAACAMLLLAGAWLVGWFASLPG